MLEIDIISHTFDFADAVNRIDQYCYKTRIPPKVSEKLQSVFEELCIQILMSVLKDPAIHVTSEYDQPQEAAEMTVEYPGNFRIEKASKTLPYAVLMARIDSLPFIISLNLSWKVIFCRAFHLSTALLHSLYRRL